MKYLSCLLFTLLCACAGQNFDEAAFPDDQVAAQMSYKRLADHGDLEPVLQDGQTFTDWQFYCASRSETSAMGSPKTITFALRDGSGIEYYTTTSDSPAVADELEMGAYGFASGSVKTVKRDLVGGDVEAELIIERWRVRE